MPRTATQGLMPDGSPMPGAATATGAA
jgi:hypothetical protein